MLNTRARMMQVQVYLMTSHQSGTIKINTHQLDYYSMAPSRTCMSHPLTVKQTKDSESLRKQQPWMHWSSMQPQKRSFKCTEAAAVSSALKQQSQTHWSSSIICTEAATSKEQLQMHWSKNSLKCAEAQMRWRSSLKQIDAADSMHWNAAPSNVLKQQPRKSSLKWMHS